jgi:hypothetical protein
MITMQMRNKNVIDAKPLHFVLKHPLLCAFTAIHQKIIITNGDYLRGGMPAMIRNGRIAA